MAKIEIREKEYALGAFLVIDGAFNYTFFKAICDATIQHDIDPLVIRWIHHELEWRKIHIFIGRKSVEAGCLSGCTH